MSENFWLSILTAFLATVPPTVAALAGLQKLNALHIDVNSRLTKMLELAAKEGDAQGQLKGRDMVRAEMRLNDALNNHAAGLPAVPSPQPPIPSTEPL